MGGQCCRGGRSSSSRSPLAGALGEVPRFNLIAAGLAFFAFVFMWNAAAAA